LSGVLVVVGLGREARIVGARGRVAVGSAGLEAALGVRPAGIVSFGLCGALDPALRVGDTVVGVAVASDGESFETDAAWATQLAGALPGAGRVGFAAGDSIIATLAAKAALRERTGAGAVDMESHLVAAAAARIGVPFAILRVVSDTAHHSLPRAAQAGFTTCGEPDVGAVLRALVQRPWELPALVRTALDAETAFRVLARCAEALGPPPG